jgi:hypothetical protein
VTNCTAPWHGLRPFSQRAKQARASRKQHTINRPSTPGSRASIPDSSPYPRTPPPGTRGTLRKLWRGQAVATAGHGTDTALHHDPGVDGRDPGARIRIISARQIGSSSRATSPQSSRLLPRCTAAIRWPRPASSAEPRPLGRRPGGKPRAARLVRILVARLIQARQRAVRGARQQPRSRRNASACSTDSSARSRMWKDYGRHRPGVAADCHQRWLLRKVWRWSARASESVAAPWM